MIAMGGLLVALYLPKGHNVLRIIMSTALLSGIFLFLSGGLSLISRLLSSEGLSTNDWLPLALTLLGLLIIFPVGYMFGHRFLQDEACSLITAFRKVFCFGSLISIILIDLGSFLGWFYDPYQNFFGMMINMGRGVFFNYPWVIQGPVLFLVLIIVIFLALALIPVPFKQQEEEPVLTNPWCYQPF